MGSLLRAASPVRRLWRAAVRPASSVGGAELLHPAKPNAMVRAVAARMAREMERFLVAYIDPLFVAKNTCTSSKHSKSRNWYPMRGVRSKFHSEGNRLLDSCNKTKGRMEGDEGAASGEGAVGGDFGRSADEG